MKNIYLPFQIGEQYENWEFDLELIEEEKILGYDSYFYIGKKALLQIIPNVTELVFCLDSLQAVVMEVKNVSPQKIKLILVRFFGDYIEHRQQFQTTLIFTLEKDVVLWLIYYPLEDKKIITYGTNEALQKLFSV